jgi:DNA-binding MarR family transcriptional regulator
MQPPRDAQSIHRAIEALQRLSELFLERRRQLAREAGLTESQWRLLEELADEDFMPSLFARRRDCTRAAVSRGLKALLERNLATVAIAEGDARQRVYRLTPRGRETLARLRTRRAAAIAEIWERFGADELDGFVRFASELGDALERFSARERRASASR